MSKWFIPNHKRAFLLPTPSQPSFVPFNFPPGKKKNHKQKQHIKVPIAPHHDTHAPSNDQADQAADVSQSDELIQDIVDSILNNATLSPDPIIEVLDISDNLNESIRSLDHPDLSDSLGNPLSNHLN